MEIDAHQGMGQARGARGRDAGDAQGCWHPGMRHRGCGTGERKIPPPLPSSTLPYPWPSLREGWRLDAGPMLAAMPGTGEEHRLGTVRAGTSEAVPRSGSLADSTGEREPPPRRTAAATHDTGVADPGSVDGDSRGCLASDDHCASLVMTAGVPGRHPAAGGE